MSMLAKNVRLAQPDNGKRACCYAHAVPLHCCVALNIYILDLDIVDSNDCPNQNTVDYQILVSTEPVLDGTTTDFSMCVNEVEDLVGMVEGVQYIAEPSVDFGDGLYIPDDQTQCFYSELTFTSFFPGSEVIDANADSGMTNGAGKAPKDLCMNDDTAAVFAA